MGFHPLKRRLQINWRNHRKLLIVDGKTAFVGGFNLGEMYLEGRDPENPVWRDVHFRMVGRIAHHLEKVFREDWHFATGQSIDPLAKADGSTVFPSDSNLTPVLCLPFSSGPSDGRASFHTALLSVLYEAKRRVWISTAYFVPDKALLQALRQAVARGVDVRLVLPRRSNHPITDFCTTSYFQELTEIGVVLNLYNPGMLHAKILLADEDLVLTGSSNQDYRSFFLNFELDLLIRSATATGKINEYFQSIFNKSSILNKSEIEREYRKFSLLRRIARLCSPLM